MVANLPNLLTLTRILLLPFFAAALIYNEYNYALMIFAAASITDYFDGLVARLRNQVTYFGTILDPVADKFFLFTSFILMTTNGLIPKWITVIVISKDLIVITGSIIVYFVTDQLKVESNFLGKISSASQFILIGIILLLLNINDGISAPMFLFVIVAVLTSVSGIQYVYIGLKAANDEKKP